MPGVGDPGSGDPWVRDPGSGTWRVKRRDEQVNQCINRKLQGNYV